MKRIRGILSQPTFKPPFVYDNMPTRLGFWMQVDGQTVHIQGDPDMDAETFTALQKMLSAAIDAIRDGKLGSKHTPRGGDGQEAR